jgi:hypothetical protein
MYENANIAPKPQPKPRSGQSMSKALFGQSGFGLLYATRPDTCLRGCI